MDPQNSPVNAQPKVQPKVQPKAQPKAKKNAPPELPQYTSGPEMWDGNNSGWTLVSYSRKKKNKR